MDRTLRPTSPALIPCPATSITAKREILPVSHMEMEWTSPPRSWPRNGSEEIHASIPGTEIALWNTPLPLQTSLYRNPSPQRVGRGGRV